MFLLLVLKEMDHHLYTKKTLIANDHFVKIFNLPWSHVCNYIVLQEIVTLLFHNYDNNHQFDYWTYVFL
jgi:hypothetical protein